MRIDILIERALEKRKPLFNITNAYRIVNSYPDGFGGITIDKYNNHFVIQSFSAADKNIDINKIADFVVKKFNPDYLILKYRNTISALNQPPSVIIAKASSQTIIQENNLKFSVEVNGTLNTGLFLDMRRNRNIISGLVSNKSVLNCFSYTCSFGVYSRSSNASRVVNIDINKKVLERGIKNYALNGLSWEKDEFRRAGVFDYIVGAFKRKNFFDIIILDPPTFSRYGKEVFSVKKDFPKLVKAALGILKPKGHLFISTNCSEISHSHLRGYIKKSGASPKKLVNLGQDIDFPGSNLTKESYLAALLVDF